MKNIFSNIKNRPFFIILLAVISAALIVSLAARDVLADQVQQYQELVMKFEIPGRGMNIQTLNEKFNDAYQTAGLERCLADIAEACQNKNYDAVYEIMDSEEFETAANFVNEGGESKDFETPFGMVGIYPVDTEDFGQCMVYCGDYQGTDRSGNGCWFGYCDGKYYYAEGTWSADRPNGEQTTREWEEDFGAAGVIKVMEGNVIDGLWDGPVVMYFEWNGGRAVYPVRFEMGQWVILEQVENLGMYKVSEYGYTDELIDGMMIDEETANEREGIKGACSK